MSRPLTEKKKPQLLGLREGWGALVIGWGWEWSGQVPLPLRLMAEFALSARLHLQGRRPAVSPERTAQESEERVNWVRARGPFFANLEGAPGAQAIFESRLHFGCTANVSL